MSNDSTSPPPPPPGGPTPPTGSGVGGLDAQELTARLRQAPLTDLGLAGAGILGLIWSLLPYYTLSDAGFARFPVSVSENAWHGFFGWFGVLLGLAAAVLVVLRIVGIAMPFPVTTVVFALFAAAFVCILLALVVDPVDALGIIDVGRTVGYWLALLTSLAAAALSGYRFAQERGLR